MKSPTPNNFDLIRLAAAAQVMVSHSFDFMSPGGSSVAWLLSFAPGVPIFFFTSGFLISASYERAASLKEYARNRFLRIYPGLWAAVAISAILILILYECERLPLLGWVFLQGTMFQDWNPDFLRAYGIGVANGSLWTIPVELSFYAFVPAFYWFARRRLDLTALLLAVLSIAILEVLAAMPPSLFRKAALLTPVPWIGVFLLGLLAQRNFEVIRRLVEGKFISWTLATALVSIAGAYVDSPTLFRAGQNDVGIVVLFTLSGLVLSAAFTKRNLAEKCLRRNDLSYGIYILHMPIINALIELKVPSVQLAIVLTLIAAALSWTAIERPSLQLKKSAFRPV